MELCWFILTLLLTVYKSNGEIRQKPEIFANSSSNVTLTCQHDNSNHNILFWYKQTKRSMDLSLLVFSVGQNQVEIEAPFKTHKSKYAATRPEIKMSTLQINKLETEDSAVYYCATSKHEQSQPAYFGDGTKLTVLEREKQEPEVKILEPSGIEKSCKKTITLVCVAKNFYPDHVSITWAVGSKDIKDDVATDPYATQDETSKLFSITSRLKVSKKEFKPQNKFKCTVKFYKETDVYKDISAEINGIAGGGYEPEDYVKSSQWMKLAYGVFIAKSGLYGLVIFVYVWRKGSSGK